MLVCLKQNFKQKGIKQIKTELHISCLSIKFVFVKGKVGTSFKDVKAALEGAKNVALGGTSIPELLVQQVGCYSRYP